MVIFKTKHFAQWAKKIKLSDSKLIETIDEMRQGLTGIELGKFLYKKRVALANSGKRDGARTLIAYKHKDKAYFIYGFAKNEKANISAKEQEALKKYAHTLINMDLKQLKNAIAGREILEVKYE